MSIEKTIKMKNKYHCCVPNCPTYDTIDNFLRFPMDVHWREQWIKAIPTKNWIIDHSTIICIHHFRAEELALYTKLTDNKTGEVIVGKSGTPLIKQGAVPSNFNNLVKKAEPVEEMFEFRDIFEIGNRDNSPETFGDVEGVDINDFLIDYYYLKQVFEVKLKNVMGNWKIQNGSDFIIFYTIENIEVPKIISSIKIDNTLSVTVCLNGKEMDPADLTWIIPITRKINRWSQLTQLLNVYAC